MKNAIRLGVRAFYKLNEYIVWIGFLPLITLVVVIFVDGSGRYIFNKPFPGSNEYVEVSMLMLAGFAILYTTVHREHVDIDLITSRFHPVVRRVLQGWDSLLSFVTWAVLDYFIFRTLPPSYEGTAGVAHLPLLPFRLCLAIVLVITFITFLIQVFQPEKTAQEPEEEHLE